MSTGNVRSAGGDGSQEERDESSSVPTRSVGPGDSKLIQELAEEWVKLMNVWNIDELAKMSWTERQERWKRTPQDAPVSSVGMLESRGEKWGFKVTHVDTPISDIPKKFDLDEDLPW